MFEQRWLLYAFISALAASLVGIFAKLGMEEVDSTLATAVRSVVMTLMLAAVCAKLGGWAKVGDISTKAWIAIGLSGMAGATSWLFYFKAIQIGSVSQVAPIDKLSMPLAVILAVLILRDRPTLFNWAGVLLIAIGGYLAAMPRK